MKSIYMLASIFCMEHQEKYSLLHEMCVYIYLPFNMLDFYVNLCRVLNVCI